MGIFDWFRKKLNRTEPPAAPAPHNLDSCPCGACSHERQVRREAAAQRKRELAAQQARGTRRTDTEAGRRGYQVPGEQPTAHRYNTHRMESAEAPHDPGPLGVGTWQPVMDPTPRHDHHHHGHHHGHHHHDGGGGSGSADHSGGYCGGSDGGGYSSDSSSGDSGGSCGGDGGGGGGGD